MPKSGKRHMAALEKVDRDTRYALADAMKLVSEFANTKFDESVDVSIRLGVNPRHADQMIRGAVSLPNGTG